MKPESHRALLELSSFGVEELSSEDAAKLLATIGECSECHGEWLLFHQTLTTLSSSGEVNLPAAHSDQMWLVCVEHARHKHSAPALSSSDSHHQAHAAYAISVDSTTTDPQAQVVENQPFRLPSTPASPSFFGRIVNVFAVPRVGFTFAAGAALLLMAVLLAPRPQTRVATSPLPLMPASSALVSFQTPPRATATLVDYHASMGFEPASGHVSPTLISLSASGAAR